MQRQIKSQQGKGEKGEASTPTRTGWGAIVLKKGRGNIQAKNQVTAARGHPKTESRITAGGEAIRKTEVSWPTMGKAR